MVEFLLLETFVLPHVTLAMSYTPVVPIILSTVRVMGAGLMVMLHMRAEEVMCNHILNAWFSVENKCYTIVASDSCSPLNDPNNGVINCYLGDDGVPSFEGICSFTCNTGYELTGSDTRTCMKDGSWSGTDAVCERG